MAAGLRFEARRGGSEVLALAVVMVVVAVVGDASERVVADLKEEASVGGATAALDELAEVIVGFRAFLAAIAALVASDDGAAVLARPALVASGLVRAFLVADPPVASPAARRFVAIEAPFSVFVGLSRRTRLDGSGDRFALGARLREGGGGAVEVSIAS